MNIVLAEDDSSLRELLASALKRDGHEVVQAASGNELIEHVRGLLTLGMSIDLLISDIRMPKMSGLVVLRLLRDAELDVPVILITAFSDAATRREATECGATVLDKPVALHVLREEVSRVLAESANRPVRAR